MRALYVLDFQLGDNAPSQRVRAIAKLLNLAGYSVDFLCVGVRAASDDAVNPSSNVHVCDRLEFDKWQIISKYKERVSWGRSIEHFYKIVNKVNPDLILTYGIGFPLMQRIIEFSKQQGAVVVPDETDEFEVKFHGNLANYIDGLSRKRAREELHPKAAGVIAISRYFKNKFNERGVPAFFLPSIVPEFDQLSHLRTRRNSDDGICFVYAGSLGGGKDLIAPFLSAMRTLQESSSSCNVKLEIIGPTFDEINSLCDFDIEAIHNVFIYGRQSHEFVHTRLLSADFGLLLRKPELYAIAGFSTKFGECMSLGVPMFCNAVGGADSELDNWVNGVVVADYNVNTLVDAISHICNLDSSSLLQMRRAAREKAEQLFNVDVYVNSFKIFLEGLHGMSEGNGRADND